MATSIVPLTTHTMKSRLETWKHLEAWTFVNASMKCPKAYARNVHLAKPKKTFTPSKTPTP